MTFTQSFLESQFGGPQRCELPLDYPRGGIQTYIRDEISIHLDAQLVARIEALATSLNVSLQTVFCAALGSLLLRYTDQSDISIGTLVCPARMLPLRLNLTPESIASETIQTVSKSIEQASSDTDDSVLELWQRLAEEDPTRAPLFQVMLIVLDGVKPEAVSEVDVNARRQQIERCDAVIFVHRQSEGVVVQCEYNTDLFEAESVNRHLEHLAQMLRGFVHDPSTCLIDVPLLSEKEKTRLLHEWNATAVDYPCADVLHTLFEQQVARTPEATALVSGDRRLSYSELNQRANQLAHHLRKKGVSAEDLVGVFMERSIEMVVALFGILKSGAAYVPLDPDYPAERLDFMLDDAGIGVLLTQESLSGRLPTTDAFHLYLDRDWADVETESGENPSSWATLDNLAYVIFTSGSTGRPKGVMNTHRGICNRLQWMQDAFQLDGEDAVLQKTPFSFDVSVWEFFWPLLVGARLVIAAPGAHRDTGQLVELIRDTEITTLHFVPSMLQLFVEDSDVKQCTSLKRVICSGEALTCDLTRRFFDRLPHCELHNLYGPTEAAVDVSHWKCQSDSVENVVPIGRPIANTRLYILDRAMQPVPIGVAGELHIGGIQVARGYLNRDELTAEKFIEDPFSADATPRLYKTGDLARYRSDGNIEFLGRIDHQVKIRGLRVELGEIETHLRQIPQIRECVVMMREDVPGDRRLVAYVVPQLGDQIDTRLLADRLRKTLPEYMVPSPILCLKSIPLSPNGKIDRKGLPSPESLRQAAGLGPVSNRSNSEAIVAGIWAEVLGLSDVGLQENFFDLGGHSILVAKVQRKIEDVFAIELPMAELFKYTTVKSLAQRLDGGVDVAKSQRNLPTKRRAARGTVDIAIVGMACRLPGADNIDSFWANLHDGVESISFFSKEELLGQDIPAADLENSNYIRARAVLNDADCFDAEFFGYSPREAELIDPQQRVFLECAWHALEDAGYGKAEQELCIGVYAGAGMNTYLVHNLHQRASQSGVVGAFQVMIGNDKDFLPTRVSYKLNLKGPSINIQTACSTSLVAVHTACRALAEGECQMAVAGGTTVHVPQTTGYEYQEGMILSSDGHCRAFDEKADGTVFGSGVAAVVLKRLDDALADGDQIHAVIKGSAINNDGSMKIGYTAPSVEGQSSVIASAHVEAGVSAESIVYVEAHGTATKLGDPIEIEALTQAFRRQTNKSGFCGVGSVKSNIGHVDAAAGVTGLIKTVLALKHRIIPPSLHFKSPNPAIDFDNSPFYVVNKARPWPAGDQPRRAGVSSFGIGGTNAHVVLEEAPQVERQAAAQERDSHLLTLSARNQSVLSAMASDYADWLDSHKEASLGDVCFTANTGRGHFAHRLAVRGHDAQTMASNLRRFVDSGTASGIVTHLVTHDNKIAFLMTGQGAQYAGMGRELYASAPVFRAELDRCAEILNDFLDLPLLTVMHAGAASKAGLLVDDTRYTQPALFAVEYALTQLWRTWGVEPTVLLGHSVGEYVAACIAGVFSLEDALKLIAHRGRLMSELPRNGTMLVVFAPEATVAEYLSDYQDSVSLAAVNGPASCVISGSRKNIDSIAEQLGKSKIETRELNVSHAFHSPLMEPILPAFAKIANEVNFAVPSKNLISNVTGTLAGPEMAEPDYWVRHVRQPVRFYAGMNAVSEMGCQVYLEVGPQPALLGMGRRFFTAENLTWTASLRKGAGEWQQMLDSAGSLYTRGVEIDWAGLDAPYDRRRVSLPGYPFVRQRHWVESISESAPATIGKGQKILLGERLPLPLSSEIRYQSRFDKRTPPYIKDHRVFGILVVAGASHCAMLLMAANDVLRREHCRIEDIFFLQPFVLPENAGSQAQLVVSAPQDGECQLQLLSLKEDADAGNSDGWILHLRGNLKIDDAPPVRPTFDLEAARFRCQNTMDHHEFYDEYWVQASDAGPSFRWLENVWMGNDEAIAQTRLPNIPENPAEFQLHPGVIEACFQVLRACREFESQALLASGGHIYVPFAIGRFEFYEKPASNQLWCYARIRPDSGQHSVIGDLILVDETGKVLAEIDAFECRRLPQETLLKNLHTNTRDWLYELAWQRTPLTIATSAGDRGHWLVFGDTKSVGADVASCFEKFADSAMLVNAGEAFAIDGDGNYTINPQHRADFERLIMETSRSLDAAPGVCPFQGIVHTWGDCESALNLLQGVLAAKWNRLPKFCFVTCGSQQIGETAPSNARQAQLWGFSRVLLQEHPETRCVCADLDEAFGNEDIESLVQDLQQESAETQLAYRAGQKYVAKIVRYHLPANIVDRPISIGSDATYLITGGTGGLGKRVAVWLAETGARHLVLSSRSGLSTPLPLELQQLKDDGIDVRIFKSDVSQSHDLQAMLEEIRVTMPPLKGLIHTAGVLDDGMLLQQDWSRFLKVCQPKVAGTWNLHQQTAEMDLDFFVCFSSATALLVRRAKGVMQLPMPIWIRLCGIGASMACRV